MSHTNTNTSQNGAQQKKSRQGNPHRFDRRLFLQSTAATLASCAVAAPAFAQERNPNSKLNLACIGVAGRAAASVSGVQEERIVALCDVVAGNLTPWKQQLPSAKCYADFRRMYDELGDTIDAVTVGTPDHTHAVAAMFGMKRGIHCYCEKPLCHDVYEVTRLMEVAAEKKLVTQMGTQIHAEPNYRRVVEHVRSGVVGEVKEVHVWCGSAWGGEKLPTDTPPVPEGLDWDLWLGPAPYRPYHPTYVPGGWRRWWAFGNGTLGDMACHLMDLPFWALGLSYPKTVEAFSDVPADSEGAPAALTAKYVFPRPGGKDLPLVWYDGRNLPEPLKAMGVPNWGMGVVFVGEEGILVADYTRLALLPEEKFQGYKVPDRTIPDSIGHYQEWLKAIKENKPEDALCRFEYAGPLTISVLLGTVAYRTAKKLNWDAKTMTVTNAPEAAAFLKQPRRDGWSVE